MNLLRRLALGAVILAASAGLSEAQTCVSTCEQQRDECRVVDNTITNWAACEDQYNACVDSCSPISYDLEEEEPQCPEGVSCYMADPLNFLDALCRSTYGSARYIGATYFRLRGRLFIQCWYWW